MKPEVLYQPPVGSLIQGATVQRILDDVLNRDESYWGSENCHGAIYLGTNLSFAPTLVIVYKEGLGFHLQLSEVDGTASDTFIPSGNDDYQDVVRVWVGQNEMRLPRAFFIDRVQASQIVEAFCRTGRRDPGFNWIRKRDSDWLFYEPEDEDDDEDA
jgi:hypothetical protein